MNKNDECEIVKDLAIQYVEDIINDKSKIFVEKHLEHCDSCKKYYNEINLNIQNENKNEIKNEKFELDFLKKIRRNMNILKITLISILLIISFIICGIFIRYRNTTQLINKSYERIETVKALNNYKLIQKTIYIDYENDNSNEIITNYYYKDGKYKINYGNTTIYCEDNSNNLIYLYDDLKQIDYCKQNFAAQRKGSVFDLFSEIKSYKNELSGLYKLILSNYTDRFNGIDCYVLRMGNKDSYKDVWIDKNTYNVLKVVDATYSKYYRETIYTLIENNVIDEDVDSSILNESKYNGYTRKDVTYNATEEIKNIYEMSN